MARRLMTVLYVSCAWLAILNFANAYSAEFLPSDATAEQILAAMQRKYAACTTYRDEGSVQYLFNPMFRRQILRFSTQFIRPEEFRFEVNTQDQLENERYLIWAHGPEIRTWSSLQPEGTPEPSLDLALAGASNASGGSAHTVPALLLPNRISGSRIAEIANASRLPDELFHGSLRYRIAGQFDKHPTTIWIDRNSLLIVRIDASSESVDTMTIYHPQANVPLAADDLLYDPPSGVRLWVARVIDGTGIYFLGAIVLLFIAWQTWRSLHIEKKMMTVEIDEKWARRANSPLMLVVGALSGVSFSFAPLYLYQSGQGRFTEPSWWLVPTCFVVIYCVAMFYMSLSGEVLRYLYEQQKAKQNGSPIFFWLMRTTGTFIGRFRTGKQ